ncbi:MAG: biopolymer transporter ExbD [Myxococcales bacterium]|nr:biopolymer transporter ExbD [Myxococcales bacterium]
MTSRSGSFSDKSKSREELIADWVASEADRQRKERKARRLPDGEATVTINSLMDAMTIILVFLLMNYSIDPLRIDSGEDLKLPASTTEISPEPSASVTVTAKGIVVNDKVVVELHDGLVDKADKAGDENSLNVTPLFDALNDEAARQKEMARLSGSRFDGVLTVIAHEETAYRVITEVLYTAGQAEFQKFKFAVLKGGQRGT